ncbi:MAG TPA: hypothetical protein PKC27_08120, partial [Methanomethylovorans sp.]|nr:hypothetical protein [Methanomethylovorans sp.]
NKNHFTFTFLQYIYQIELTLFSSGNKGVFCQCAQYRDLTYPHNKVNSNKKISFFRGVKQGH